METKKCSKCHITKSIDNFYASHVDRTCIDCHRKRNKEYKKLHPEIIRAQKQRYKERGKGAKAYARSMSKLEFRFRRWEINAKKRGIVWDLTFDDIKDMPMTCFYSEMELTLKPNQLNTISLDRKNSDLGYTKTNVVFASAKINRMKSDMSINDFLMLCKLVTNKCPG
jgi:hypothetical protein